MNEIMKIGIITWFNGINYGTNLQAIALQKFLKEQGYDVKLINFSVTSERTPDIFIKKLFQPKRYIRKYVNLKYKKEIKERERNIAATTLKNCSFTKKINSEKDYIEVCNSFDLLICGSDQIWNPNLYHRFYYADFKDITTRKIAYAPSLGVSDISAENAVKLKKSIKGFESVSVREDEGAKILEKLLHIKPQVVVDPTMLISADEWNKLASKRIENDRYVLSMFLTDNLRHWHAAKKFAAEKDLKHVVVPYCEMSYMQGDRRCIETGTEDMLALIRDAEYVITDSFHITVFSVLFQRQFMVFQRFKSNAYTSQNSRVECLLRATGLEARYIPYGTDNIRYIIPIDYDKVNSKLQTEIESSKNYLLRAVEGV